MREKLLKILEEIVDEYIFLGIRGTDKELEINQILETSYDWDFEKDCSSFFTENPIELGGVCAIDCATHNWNNYFCTEKEDFEEMIDLILERIDFCKKNYPRNKYYLIGSKRRNPLDMEENDEFEVILEDAKVFLEV